MTVLQFINENKGASQREEKVVTLERYKKYSDPLLIEH